jgi:hypothetical protein
MSPFAPRKGTFIAGNLSRSETGQTDGHRGTEPQSLSILGDLDDGNLRWSTDFRSIYATLLSDWLHLPADAILGGKFPAMPLLKG